MAFKNEPVRLPMAASGQLKINRRLRICRFGPDLPLKGLRQDEIPYRSLQAPCRTHMNRPAIYVGMVRGPCSVRGTASWRGPRPGAVDGLYLEIVVKTLIGYSKLTSEPATSQPISPDLVKHGCFKIVSGG